MNISGISPWYFNGGQKRDYPQKRREQMASIEAMAERHFNRELDDYLERTSKEPYTPCCCCGRNIFDFDQAFKFDGEWHCGECIKAEYTVNIEPEEWR
jgi:hypothetical protein